MMNFNFNKTVIELEICGEPYIMTIDMKTVIHYKKVNKTAFLGALQKIGDLDEMEVIKLLASMIRKDEKATPVGIDFFKDFNPIEVVANFTPLIITCMGENLPEAEGEEEKK